MKQTILYALDFDGVICDSAVETGITGWKAAIQIWDDLPTPLPEQQLLDNFRLVRPILETGYEAILIIRLLYDGETVAAILDDFCSKKQLLIEKYKLNIITLKNLFGATRDYWINDDLDDWVKMNPLFPSVAKKLQNLAKANDWYIITTKQERFVKQILSANQIQLADDRIFGLDKNMSKEVVLQDLVSRHSEKTIYFVEDRLPTLINIIKNQSLFSVKLFFALWGYNTSQDKLDAKNQNIELIEINSFLRLSNT